MLRKYVFQVAIVCEELLFDFCMSRCIAKFINVSLQYRNMYRE